MHARILFCSFAALAASACFTPARADAAAEIRERLMRWTDDFNARRAAAACDLFSRDLISTIRGQGDADYDTRCALISSALTDRDRTFHYAPQIREVIVRGDMAIVRLVWTLTIMPGNITSTEPGLDVFRKEGDGKWRIIRFLAYEE